MKLRFSTLKKLSVLVAVVALCVSSLGAVVQALPLEQPLSQVPGNVAVSATTDVEATMKAMALHYKKALAATDIPQMENEIKALQHEVARVQQYQFPAEKQQLFQKGLSDVQQQLLLVQQSLFAGDLASAKQQLGMVDKLKKQYHKERSPSFWQLLFGG